MTALGAAAGRVGLDTDGAAPADIHNIAGVGHRSVSAAMRAADTIEIGDLLIQHMKVAVLKQRSAFATVKTGSPIPEDYDLDVLIGADFMSKVHVWISNSSHTMILRSPPAASPG